MISFLMPSRERVQLAKESIESLGEGDFEVLVWVDKDDPQLEEYRTLPYENVRVFPRERVGYKNFHKMINELASKAKGDWLILWNDDALMEGDWVNQIQIYDHKRPSVINFFDPDNTRNNLFPALSRKMYEIMGHYSLSTHCDSWVQDVANELGIHIPVYGIKAHHRRGELNDTTKETTQATYVITSPLYESEEMQIARYRDAERIRRKL